MDNDGNVVSIYPFSIITSPALRVTEVLSASQLSLGEGGFTPQKLTDASPRHTETPTHSHCESESEDLLRTQEMRKTCRLHIEGPPGLGI